ncbi:MAG TPA: hypothetical protein PLO61_09575 [Fimbriimonadaceae bacterium]|nr:hypothetical protein [Fimbriimonadaceae bacterium]HRJ32925.1 hypothetical protein [Fimbriimonadaceae bacterium]
MASLQIRTWTVADIEASAAPFAGLSDPDGFVANCGESWRSLVLKNPYQEPSDLAMVLALDGDTIVGRLGFFQARIRIRGEIHKTYWTDGFFLNSAYRESGAGGMILLRSVGLLKTICAAGGPDEAAQKLYKAAGFRFLGAMRRYVRLFKGRMVTGRVLGESGFSNALGLLVTPLLALLNGLKAPRAPKLKFTPVNRFGAEVDQLFAQTQENAFCRDAATLNWLLEHREVQAFLISHNDQPKGYLLLKKYFHKGGGKRKVPSCQIGCILDWVLVNPSEQDRQDLVHFSMKTLQSQGVDLFEMNVFPDEFDKICKELGMLCSEGTLAFVKPPPGVSLQESDAWFLTPGAADMLLIKP